MKHPMKMNSLRWLAVSVAVVAAAASWYLFGTKPESAPGTVSVAKAQRLYVKPSGPSQRAPESGRILERGKKWLDSRGNDAASLIAMWDLTRDEEVLAEVASRFPDDPRVCHAMIARSAGDARQALPWIEGLIAAEPTNPEGFYQQAWALMTLKDRAGAMESLRQAGAATGPRDNHKRDRITTAREAAIAGGASPAEAARLALAPSLQTRTRSPVLTGAAHALQVELGGARGPGSEDRLMNIVGIGLATADKLANGGAVSLSDAREAVDLQTEMLGAIPPDTEIGAGGRTAGALLQEARERRDSLVKALTAYHSVPALLNTASDEVVVAYANLFQEQGEYAAVQYLLQQTTPAAPAAPAASNPEVKAP